MSKKNLIIVGLIAIVVILAAGFFYQKKAEAPTEDPSSEPPTTKTYRSGDAGITFTYDMHYYADKREAGTPTRPQTTIVLVEDTEENRNLLDGKIIEPREGPTAMTIEVYQNPQNLSAETWATQDPNWNISSKQTASTTVDGISGVSFLWDGLYAGKSVIVTKNAKAYVFSVTWMSEGDRIRADFEQLLSTVQFDE